MLNPRDRFRPFRPAFCVALALFVPALAHAQSTNPTGTASPAPCGCATVQVTPGQFPPSTGLVVTIDLSAFGGAATKSMLDDGTNGDVTAGDNFFTCCGFTPPTTLTFVPFTVSDAQGRSSTGFLGLAPPATCPSGGGGGLGIMSLYDVTGVATNTPFSISVGVPCCFGFYDPSVPGVVPSGVQSTDEANLRDAFVNAVNAFCPGMAVSIPFNGSSTTVHGRFALATTCLLGVAADVGVGPAGTPAAAHCVVAFGNPSGCVFNPRITGAAGSGLDCNGDGVDDSLAIGLCTATDIDQNGIMDICESHCGADLDNGLGVGVPDGGVDINDLIYFLTEFGLGNPGADIDDDGDPCIAGPGGAVPDINDLLFFLAHFEIGC